VAILVGQTISHYKILEHLGGGGMGVVYKAQDLKLDRPVALKFLPPELTRDPEAKQRFVHEAKAASTLQHNNICVIHDIDEAPDGQMFICMEYLEGETLKKKIERGPLKIEDATDVASQVGLGLGKAHEHGIVHRDIKPANIMMTADGVAKIVDFGVAKLSGRTMLTKAGATLGTLAYMSPEQTRGEEVDRRTDIWSLGVVLYEMLVGRLPFKGDYENVVVYEIANTEAEPVTSLRTGVPMDLERIVNKAMAKSTDERYQHVDEMLVDLKRLRKESEVSAVTRQHPAPALQKKPFTKRVLLPAALLMVLAAAFFLTKPLLFEEILISEPKPVAVIAFVNQTGDPSYDYLREAIPNLLITSLEQSKYLRVMTWERMNDVLKQMGKANVGLIDKDLGFELCRREGIHAIVIGSFVKAGETFATDVKVLDVSTKELLKTASARGEGVQSILNLQIDQLSKEIARGVGLSQRKVESAPSQIAEVTTSSMDAYNFFLRGREEYEKLYYAEAGRFLEKAVSLDSTFALAYLYLAKTYGRRLEFTKMTEAIEKAKTLSSRAPEKERIAIEARYAAVIEKNSPKRLTLLEELVRKYPQEKRFHDELGQMYQSENRVREAQSEYEKAILLDPNFASPTNGLAYMYAEQGLYEKAIQTLQRYAALSPGDANPYDSMGEMYLLMGNLEESIARYHEAIRVQPSFYPAYKSLAYVYALKEEYVECLGWIDSALNATPTIGLKAEAMTWKISYLMRVGRVRESLRELGLLAGLIPQMGTRAFLAPLYWMKASAALNRGQANKARQEFATFHDIYSENNPRTPVSNRAIWNIVQGLVYLREGHNDSARTCVDEIRPVHDSLESLKGTLIMLSGNLEAELLLAEGRPDSAIHVYRATPVIGPSMAVGWRLPLYNFPSSRDVVPRAFQAKGELDSAIVEYERMLKIDSTTRDRRLISPLYHYRLARVCELKGRTDEAEAQYRRFLELWNDADRDLPELIDARKQLAKLAQGKSR